MADTTMIGDEPTRTRAAGHDALLEALELLAGTGPEFGGFLSNHGPMAADAMIRLGGDDQVGRWVDRYRRQLDAAPTGRQMIDEKNWHHHLGDMRYLGDWIDHFEHAATEQPWRELLSTWWPRLLPGVAAGAAHGLLRTAHAVRSLATAPATHPLLIGELAQGLAYWAAGYQSLPGTPTLRGRFSALEAVGSLPRLPESVPSTGPGLVGRLRSIVAVRELPDALDGWAATASGESLDELISVSARLVANREDSAIALCHAFTAPAAVRMVLSEIPDELHHATVAATWQLVGGVIAAAGGSGSPSELADVDVDRDVLESPGELAGRAIQHGDDHVIKLTEAAIRQYERTSDPTLLVAAARFRRRSDRPR